MLQRGAARQLFDELVGEYNDLLEKGAKTRSPVVIIEASTAGSPLVRALFDLYKTVEAGGGQVIVVGYPSQYIASLTALGLTALPGFFTTNSKQDALTRLANT